MNCVGPQSASLSYASLLAFNRLQEAKGFHLRVHPAVLTAVLAEGYSDEYGVRPLRQTIIRCAHGETAWIYCMGKLAWSEGSLIKGGMRDVGCDVG